MPKTNLVMPNTTGKIYASTNSNVRAIKITQKREEK
jgi:hypothetical protein